MNRFDIIKNVSRKGERSPEPLRLKKSINYLAIPFREMQIGDCVLVKEKEDGKNVKSCVKVGVRRALGILNMEFDDFLVDWTKDKSSVAVWRIK